MDVINSISYGFSIGLQPENLLFCFLGVLMGTLVGVLPGIGPIGAMSILLPATFRIPPVGAIIMLAGIFYGAQYGGSITSILVNIPGEASSIVTCLDGYQMARQGRAGPALGIAAFGSFIAGTLGVVGLMLFARPLVKVGLKFGPPEYFGLMLLGLTLVTYLSSRSVLKSLIMAVLGVILSSIGLDPINATSRMTFDIMYLWDGVGLIPLAMGLFGISEVLVNIETTANTEILKTKIKNLFPTMLDWMQSIGAIVRGSVLGFFLGILPGGGVMVSSFASYGLEKRISKHPDKFGKGTIEAVAGPESANNSASSGSFVPLLTLGIPPNVTMALLYGALTMYGVRPGPLLLKDHPDIFWGLISSMYIGNGMLLVLNLPLIPFWVQLLKVPYRVLFPLILLFCLIGCYSLNSSTFDVILMTIFGGIGYLFRKLDYEAAPLVLAFILGPMLEINLRQSLLLSKGSFLIFYTRPISAGIVTFAIVILIIPLISYFYKWKKKAKILTEFSEVDET